MISFGKKVFRTRVIRHSLDPVWEEKLLFHVRRYETSFKINFSVLDWDKLSGNDHVAEINFDVSELIASAPQKDPVTGLYPEHDDDGQNGMKEFTRRLETSNSIWESKHSPQLTFRLVLSFILSRSFYRRTHCQLFTVPSISLTMLFVNDSGARCARTTMQTITDPSLDSNSQLCLMPLVRHYHTLLSIPSTPAGARTLRRIVYLTMNPSNASKKNYLNPTARRRESISTMFLPIAVSL